MQSRVFWRRTAAAAGIYSSVVLGFAATSVAAHIFSSATLGLYAIVLAAAGFFASLLDVTVEEALVKFGFRFVTREDWGRLRRLFESAIAFKILGGVLAALALLAFAPLSHALLHKGGLETPLMIAALLPLAQCVENVAGVALILHGRYDIRGFFLLVSMALRLAAIAVGASHGLTTTIAALVVAQVVATAAVSTAGVLAYLRFPRAAAVPLGTERRGIGSFLLQSSIASGVTSLTLPAATLVLGRVATARDVGWFRVALAPQQGFASLTSPARLVLLTEQTRAWERGTRDVVFAGIRRYMIVLTMASIVLVPLLLVFTPDLVRLFFASKNLGAVHAMRIVIVAGALRMVFGWTKSFPVSIGRPNLRIRTHVVEMVVLIPLAGLLGAKWGATGAAAAVLASSIAFCLYWTVLYLRIRREPEPPKRPIEAVVASGS